MMQRPDAVAAICARYERGFESNASEDEMASELWQGVGALVKYVEELEAERDGLAEELSLSKQMLVETMRTLADEFERRTTSE